MQDWSLFLPEVRMAQIFEETSELVQRLVHAYLTPLVASLSGLLSHLLVPASPLELASDLHDSIRYFVERLKDGPVGGFRGAAAMCGGFLGGGVSWMAKLFSECCMMASRVLANLSFDPQYAHHRRRGANPSRRPTARLHPHPPAPSPARQVTPVPRPALSTRALSTYLLPNHTCYRSRPARLAASAPLPRVDPQPYRTPALLCVARRLVQSQRAKTPLHGLQLGLEIFEVYISDISAAIRTAVFCTWRQPMDLVCTWRQPIDLVCTWRQQIDLVCTWRQPIERRSLLRVLTGGDGVL
eukprot:1934647-Prymnesium_polylepis.1